MKKGCALTYQSLATRQFLIHPLLSSERKRKRVSTKRMTTMAKPSIHTLPDSELVLLAQKGEKTAFGELVNRWQSPIYTYCLRQLPNQQLAEELTQDIFVSAFKALKSFRNEAQFSTWLYRIASNRCKNNHAYRHRRQYTSHEPLEGNNPEIPRDIPSTSKSPEENVHAKDLKEILMETLSQLEEKQREILILSEIQGLPQAEIAKILSIPIGTIKSRLHRAKIELSRRMRNKLGTEEFGDTT